MKRRTGKGATHSFSVVSYDLLRTKSQRHSVDSLVYEKPDILLFTRGSHRFEIHRWDTDGQVGYVGFYDGQISVVARERHVVAKLLLLRHSS